MRNEKYINAGHTESVGLQLFDIFHSSEDGKAVFQVDGGDFRLETSDMESLRYYLCAGHAVADRIFDCLRNLMNYFVHHTNWYLESCEEI